MPVKSPRQPVVKTTGSKKQQKKKIVLTTIAVGAAGVLGYFGWQYIKKQKEKKSGDADIILKPKVPASVPYDYPSSDNIPKPTPRATPRVKSQRNNSSSNLSADFPLKRGSKGEKVKALQESMIAKYGNAIMPRYGADGQFGSEMAAALKKLKMPSTIDQTTYNVLVQGHVADKSMTAQKLYQAASAADYRTAIALLKTLKSKEDYQTVGAKFKDYRINGVRQTLVNAMLSVFTSDEQKQAIRFEFIRMGLQYDGNKWSLSGLGGLPVMTNEETTVWLNAKNGIKVAYKTVLGNEVSKRLDYTLFENNGKYFLVRTAAIKYL